MNLSKAAETESKSYNKDNYKDYWKKTELVPSSREDKQLPFLIETLKKELDINKIETVLEVGVGYGRVAKAIIDNFTRLKIYEGIDISESALNQSASYLDDYDNIISSKPLYFYTEGDFEEIDIQHLYDLVISVETMSTIPANIDCCHWIDKMISLSKKYVVNLDYIETTHPIFNNGHAYETCYGINNNVQKFEIIPTLNTNEKLYICRVK